MTYKDENIHHFVNRLFSNKDKDGVVTVEFAGIPFDVDLQSGVVQQSPDDAEVIHTKLAARFKVSVEASIREAMRFIAKHHLISKLKAMGDGGVNAILNKYEIDIQSGKNVSEKIVDHALSDLITDPLAARLGLFSPPQKSKLQQSVFNALNGVELSAIQSFKDVDDIMDKVQHRTPRLRS